MAPEVDPATGQPVEIINRAKNLERIQSLESKAAQAKELKEDIESERGQLILNRIQQQLLSRVNTLIDNDEQCKVMKTLLAGLGVEINLGQKAVDSLMKLVVRR